MLKVGITGGIGVGKTYISNILEKMGYPVFYSDIIAKEIVSKDSRLISLIKQEFGDDIYLADNKIDNKLLASIVFNDNNRLSKLNSLILLLSLNVLMNGVKNNHQESYLKKQLFFLKVILI